MRSDDNSLLFRNLGIRSALCCTWAFSCNFRGYYVARELCLATFGGKMLHVDLLLQHSEVLYCTSTFSCNFRRQYVARELRLATFGASMLHVDLLLQLSRGPICILSISTITFLLINTEIKKDLSLGFHLMDKSF